MEFEKKARKLLEGKNLVYKYKDGSKPHYMIDWHFMRIVNGKALFYYGGFEHCAHEVYMSIESLKELETKRCVNYQYGVLMYI